MEQAKDMRHHPLFHSQKETSIEEMCDMVLESLQEGYQSNLEPWEVFEEKKRKQIKGGFAQKQKRILRGFELILKELVNVK